MAELHYGPARVPSRDSPEAAIALLQERGFTACEIDFEGKFWMDYPWAERFGELAREADIVLSVHAPSAGFMGHGERGKKLNMAVGMLDHSAGIAKACGAEVVVFHPGFLLGRERAAAIDSAVEQLGELGSRRGRGGARGAAQPARAEGPCGRLRRRDHGPRARARNGGGRLRDLGALRLGPARARLRAPARSHRRRLPRGP